MKNAILQQSNPDYIDGYNDFDIEKMTSDFSDDIIFQNIQNEEVSMTLNGITAFKQQAEQAKVYYENRQQDSRVDRHILIR